MQTAPDDRVKNGAKTEIKNGQFGSSAMRYLDSKPIPQPKTVKQSETTSTMFPKSKRNTT